MTRLRQLSSQHKLLALWLGMAMLCMRMLVPTGFMPVVDARGMTLQICPGMVVQAPPPATHASMPGMTGYEVAPEHPPEHEGQPDQPCGFAGLTMPTLGTADPFALVPVFAAEQVDKFSTGLTQVANVHAHLRPPPIGPPLAA